MTTQNATSITVTRALAEIKQLDSRIGKTIQEGTYIGVVLGVDQRPANRGIANVDELKKLCTSSFDSVTALISRRQKLKEAVLRSNSLTTVSVAGRDMTVAEVIDYKEVIKYKQAFLNKLKQDQVNTAHALAKQEQELEKAIVQQVTNIYQQTEKGKIPANAREVVGKPLEDQFKGASVSGVADLPAYVKALEEEIAQFTLEVDYILSESNSKTAITVGNSVAA